MLKLIARCWFTCLINHVPYRKCWVHKLMVACNIFVHVGCTRKLARARGMSAWHSSLPQSCSPMNSFLHLQYPSSSRRWLPREVVLRALRCVIGNIESFPCLMNWCVQLCSSSVLHVSGLLPLYCYISIVCSPLLRLILYIFWRHFPTRPSISSTHLLFAVLL